ncbi:hypothetical protein KRX57_04690 [Weeksellaceae bacterium TAE3-ERU29]|nr:hypothetical protein [Weeksellaceae bacterium TAE3-ERU29]
MESTVLIKRIKEAFKNERYMGDENIVYDNSPDNDDCAELKSYFIGKKWQDLEQSLIFNHKDELSFFSKKALKYYFPAFMIDVLKDVRASDTLADNLLFELVLPLEIDTILIKNEVKKYLLNDKTPKTDFEKILSYKHNNPEEKLNDFLEFVSLFNIEQRRIIYLFLNYLDMNFSEYFLDFKSPKTAIDRYWFLYK